MQAPSFFLPHWGVIISKGISLGTYLCHPGEGTDVKLLLLPTPRCYSYFCAHLGNFNFLTGIWNVHKGILAHISLLNQHFT